MPVSRPIEAIIPARALIELARIIGGGTDGTLVMTFPPDRGQVIFHMDNLELASQLIEGNFPDYRAIVPQNFKTHTLLSTAGLLKACKQSEIIAREGTNVARLNIIPETNDASPAPWRFSPIRADRLSECWWMPLWKVFRCWSLSMSASCERCWKW